MDRRGFFSAAGGGILGASLLKLGWKTPLNNTATAEDGHSGEQLVVTATVSQPTGWAGQTEGGPFISTYTWQIMNPQPGSTFPGPIMESAGTITGLDFYSTRGEWLGHVDVTPRCIIPGDMLSLTL